MGRDDVFKVDVKDSFSFFNTEKEHEQKVLEFFTDFKYNGRFVNVEVSTDRSWTLAETANAVKVRRNDRTQAINEEATDG